MTRLSFQGPLDDSGFELLLDYAEKQEMYALLEISGGGRDGRIILASGRVALQNAGDDKSRRLAQHGVVDLIRYNHRNGGSFACKPLVGLSGVDSLPSVEIQTVLTAALGIPATATATVPSWANGGEPTPPPVPSDASSAALEADAQPAAPGEQTVAALSYVVRDTAPMATLVLPARDTPMIPTQSKPTPGSALKQAVSISDRSQLKGAAVDLATIQPQRAAQLRVLLEQTREAGFESVPQATEDASLESVAHLDEDESSRSAALRSIIRRLAS